MGCLWILSIHMQVCLAIVEQITVCKLFLFSLL